MFFTMTFFRNKGISVWKRAFSASPCRFPEPGCLEPGCLEPGCLEPGYPEIGGLKFRSGLVKKLSPPYNKNKLGECAPERRFARKSPLPIRINNYDAVLLKYTRLCYNLMINQLNVWLQKPCCVRPEENIFEAPAI